MPLDLSKTTTDQFGKYHDWNDVLTPTARLTNRVFVSWTALTWPRKTNSSARPSRRSTRVRELEPDNLTARLWLGQIYVLSRLPDRALEVLRDPLEQPEKFSLAKTNETQLNVIRRRRLFSKKRSGAGEPSCSKPKSPCIPTDDNLL